MKPGKIVHTFITKKGNKCIIRYPKWEDLDLFLRFANRLSEEDTFVLLSGERISRDREITFLSDILSAIERKKKIHLIAEIDGKLAASCGIDIADRRKKHVGDIHISTDRDFREEGIGTILMKTLIKEAKRMKLHLLTLTCVETNSRARHVYEKVGFILSGTVPGAIQYRGSYVGEVTYYLPIK